MPINCFSSFFVKCRGLVGSTWIAYLLLSSQINSSMQSVKKCRKKSIRSDNWSRLISVISSLQGTFSAFEVWQCFHWTLVFDCLSFFLAGGSGLTWISSIVSSLDDSSETSSSNSLESESKGAFATCVEGTKFCYHQIGCLEVLVSRKGYTHLIVLLNLQNVVEQVL